MTASDEAKKALEGVTPGPWQTVFDRLTWGWLEIDGISFDIGTPTRATDLSLEDEIQRKTDARFIAWAREGVPALLAEIAAKDAEIARLTAKPSPEQVTAYSENDVAAILGSTDDITELPEAYQPRNIAKALTAYRAALAHVKSKEGFSN